MTSRAHGPSYPIRGTWAGGTNVVTCPPQMLEFCHSARTPAEYARYREQISMGFPLEHAPGEDLLMGIQEALWKTVLWNGGLVRAAGPMDILIAGWAIENGATVLAADHDFDHIAAVSDLHHEYLAPGSLDFPDKLPTFVVAEEATMFSDADVARALDDE